MGNTNTRTKNGAIDRAIEKVIGLAEMMEKKLEGVEKKIDSAIMPVGRPDVNLVQQERHFHDAPLVIGGQVNALTPHEAAIRKEGFNKGLEVGMYVGAALVLLGLSRMLR